MLPKQFPVNVSECSRCGGDHIGVIVKVMAIPHAPKNANDQVWNYWAPCPTNGDPMLFQVEPEVVLVPIEVPVEMPAAAPANDDSSSQSSSDPVATATDPGGD
jgi:hypothetical protein